MASNTDMFNRSGGLTNQRKSSIDRLIKNDSSFGSKLPGIPDNGFNSPVTGINDEGFAPPQMIGGTQTLNSFERSPFKTPEINEPKIGPDFGTNIDQGFQDRLFQDAALTGGGEFGFRDDARRDSLERLINGSGTATETMIPEFEEVANDPVKALTSPLQEFEQAMESGEQPGVIRGLLKPYGPLVGGDDANTEGGFGGVMDSITKSAELQRQQVRAQLERDMVSIKEQISNQMAAQGITDPAIISAAIREAEQGLRQQAGTELSDINVAEQDQSSRANLFMAQSQIESDIFGKKITSDFLKAFTVSAMEGIDMNDPADRSNIFKILEDLEERFGFKVGSFTGNSANTTRILDPKTLFTGA